MKKHTFIRFAILMTAILFSFAACSGDDEYVEYNGTDVPDLMIAITGGQFTMGSDTGQTREKPAHQVIVSDFYISKYTVTQKLYEEIMGENPVLYAPFQGPDKPVIVDWYDAVDFCNALSLAKGFKPAYFINHRIGSDVGNMEINVGSSNNVTDTKRYMVTWDKTANGYRLPTSAEWEYACKAGANFTYTVPAPGSDNLSDIAGKANFENSEIVDVGSYEANAWGLYNMHGNVYEWCWDWASVSNNTTIGYPWITDVTVPEKNPSGPTLEECVSYTNRSQRITRGGAYANLHTAHQLRSTYWERTTASRADYGIAGDTGIRLVRNR